MTSRVESHNQLVIAPEVLPQPAPRHDNLCDKVRHAWNAWMVLHAKQMIKKCEAVCPKDSEHDDCMRWCFKEEGYYLRNL